MNYCFFGRTNLIYCVVALFLLAFVALDLRSAPYPPEGLEVEWTQPDGNLIKLRVFGDEFYARTESEDGRTVVFNKATNAYEFASLSADGTDLVPSGIRVGSAAAKASPKAGMEANGAKPVQLSSEKRESLWRARRDAIFPNEEANWKARVQQARQQRETEAKTPAAAPKPDGSGSGIAADEGDEDPPAFAVLGNQVGLTVPVQFPDDLTTATSDPVNFPATYTKVERYCNQAGYTDDGNTGSVRDYFSGQSLGQVTYTQVVAPIVTLPNPRNWYNFSDHPTNATLRDSGQTGRLVVQHAIEALKDQSFDFSGVTVNGSNRMIATNIIFAGADSGVWSEGLWPHRWVTNPIVNAGTTANPIYAYDYQITNAASSSMTIGTFCHENGHLLLKLPDLYDYGGESAGVGSLALMGSGNHVDGGRTPAPINPYFKDVSGWMNITDLSASSFTTATLPTTGNIAYRIRKPSSSTEYFILDNRGSGDIWADHVADKGIMIWHIDETVNGNNNEQMTSALHYEVSVEQADGLFNLENNQGRGDSGDAFDLNFGKFDDTSLPDAKWWDGTDSNITIEVLSLPGASMDVRFGGQPLNTITVTSPNGGESVFTSQPTNIEFGANITGDVKIDLYKAGAFHSVISPGASSAGDYLWTPPSSLPSTSDYTIRVSSLNNPAIEDFSDAAFSVVALIFGDGFETGNFRSEWTVTGTETHRTIVTQENSPRTGAWHVTMDSATDNSNARNELTLSLNIFGANSVQLEFYAKEFGDEDNAPPTNPFTNGADFDGVAISEDGVTWHEVTPLRGTAITADWQQFTVDLDAAILAAGISYNGDFRIRFNHFDNHSITTDGFAFDDVSLTGTVPPAESTLDLSTSSDSGESNSDNQTNINQPVFQGLTPPSTIVTLNSSIAGNLGTATANASGVWTIKPSTAMADGSHSVTVTPAGGSTSPELVVVIDTQAPSSPTNIDLTSGSDSGVSNSDNITNATTLNFTFSSDNGTTVSLFSSIASLIGSADVGSGISVPQLADGVHQITATASDVSGNVSSATTPFALTIDTTPPAAIAQPNISVAQDSGISDTDNITSNKNLTIDGSNSTSGQLLRLLSNGVEVGSTAGGGAWSLPLNNLSDGTRLITARQIDLAGNTTTSPAMTLQVDSTAPAAPGLDLTAASDLGSSQTDNITKDRTLQFYNSTESTASIAITESTAGFVGSGTGTFFFTTSTLGEGIHNFTSQSTDAAGNQSPVSTLNVTIDITTPGAITAPDLQTLSDTGVSDTDNITQDTTPSFSGSGSDSTATVELLSNGTSIGSTPGTGGSWSLKATIDEGTFEINARQIDLAGNKGPISPSITLVVDTTKPIPPTDLDLIAASDLGESDDDDLTADTTPTISGNSEADTLIKLFSDNEEVGTGDGGPNFQVTASTDIGDSPPSDDQQRILHALSVDLAGNQSFPSASITIIVDNKKPNFVPFNFRLENSSDSGASDVDGITSDNTPAFSASSSLGEVVKIFADDTSYSQFQTIGAWTKSTSPIPDGTYQMTARSSDTAGNLGTSSVVVPVTIDTTAPPAPSALRLSSEDDSGLSNSDSITNIRLPTIQGNAEPGEIQIHQDGVDQGLITVEGDGVWNFTPAAKLAEGNTQFTASQIDLAGNQGISNDPFSVEVDITKPEKPSIPVLKTTSDLGAFDNDAITSENQPAFIGTGENGTTVFLFDENEDPIGSGLNNADWQTSDPLDDGVHQIHARASDVAGNMSPNTGATPLTIDTIPPIVTIEQGASQEDPTIEHPIIFDVDFSEPVYGFESADVSLAGTAGASAITEINSGTDGDASFAAEVSETTGEGDVIASLPAGIATDLAGNETFASTSADHTVEKKLLPNPISDLLATDDTFEDKVELSWTDQPEATIGYRVFRNDFNLTHNAVEIATLPVGSTSFEDTAAPAGSWQFYWVRAEDEDGLSTFGQSDPGRTDSTDDPTKRAETPLEAGIPLTTSPSAEWKTSDAGKYDGLLLNSEDGTTLVGSATLTLKNPKATATTGGSLSGLIYHNGRRFGVKGAFDQNGYFQKDFLQRDKTILSVELQLHEAVGTAGEIVIGTVSHNGTSAALDCPRMPFHKKHNPAPESVVGAYTMVMPAIGGWGETKPGGDGWATVSVATSGTVKISGKLGDGTKLTEVGYLSAENQFCLYREIYRTKPAKGRVGGQLTIAERPGQSDFDGILQWVKFADTREKTYPDGFDLAVWALGSKFVAPAKNVRIFPELADQHYNAEITFVGPTPPLETPEEKFTHRAASWFANNKILHYGPEKLAAAVSYKKGTLKGSYYDPATRKKINFTGVAFQKQARTAGVFSYGGKTGAVRIKPGTDWVYPGSDDPGAVTDTSAPRSPANGPNLTAIAHDPAAAGSYHGVLKNASSSEFSGGIESVKYNSSGTLTGRIWIDGLRYSFKGAVDPGTGAIITSINRKGGLPPIDLVLQLGLADGTTDGFQISGTVDTDGVSHNVDAQKNPHSKTAPSPHVGRYTVAIIAPVSTAPALEPAGDGYGTISVSTTGTCKGAFTLADGTKATIAGHHSRNDQWSIHRRIYSKPTGFLAGNLTFRELPDISDVDGEIRWVKLSGSRPTTVYPNGFDSLRAVVGSQFTRPAKGVSAFSSLSDSHHNAWLRIENPDLEHPLTWAATNKITYYGPESIKLKFNVKTGLISGSYVDKPNGISIRMGGVFLEDQQLVTGFHLTGGKSNRIVIEHREQ